MAGQLQHLRSSTANKRPTASGLIDGRIAINTASGSPGLFFKDNAGTVVKVGPVHVGSSAPNASPASGGSSGNSIGEQWLDNSGGNYVFKIWDGSAWRSETGEFVNASGDTMTGDLVMNDANIVFEGSTEDGFETILTVVDPTADRTITFPNVTGTVVTTGDSGTVTSTMIADGTIVNADINSSAAIAPSKIGAGALPTNVTVASANIVDGTIVNADVNASAAIAGTKIDPDFGSQTVETTGVINAGAGTEAAPSVSVRTTDNGLYSPGTDQVAISTNGTGRLFIDSSGNVGINTGSPSVKLDVVGQFKVRASTPGAYALVEYGDSATATNNWHVGTEGDGTFRFYNGLFGAGSERLRITSDGKLGIGTTSPGSALEINAAAATSPFIAKINTSEAARIDSSGRLLIGTSSVVTLAGTGSAQQIFSTSQHAFSWLRGSNDAFGVNIFLAKSRNSSPGSRTALQSNDEIGTIAFIGDDGTDLESYAGYIRCELDGTPGANDMPGRLVFSVTADGSASPTEAMRINNAGELLVGYFTDNGAYKLQVNSQIFATSATIATSDGRYKENVAPLNGCLDLVKTLRPVSFTWKPQEDITRLDEEGNEVLVREGHNFPEGTQVGFIAQEVQEVLDGKPWLGSVIKENVRPAVKDNDGNELAPEEQFYGIAEGNLIAVLTNALQEAVVEIESLKARLDAANI